jgi:hypothetical protein
MTEAVTPAGRDPVMIELDVLHRLRPSGLTGKPTISGFYHPETHQVLRDMEARGLIEITVGEGRDRGMLLVKLTPAKPKAVSIDSGEQGGCA